MIVSNTVGSDSLTSPPGSDYMDSYGNFPQMNERPKMPQLYSLKRSDGGKEVRIIDRIATKYRELGTMLLNDDNGNKMDNIVEDARGNNPTRKIIVNIFSKWLSGEGTSVSWNQLVDTLRDVKLKQLANDIVDALKSSNTCKYIKLHLSVCPSICHGRSVETL